MGAQASAALVAAVAEEAEPGSVPRFARPDKPELSEAARLEPLL